MKLLIACMLAVLASVPALAQEVPTLDDRLAELGRVEAVDKIRLVEQPKSVPGFEHDANYNEAKITYTWIEGDATYSNTVAVRISERGAYWYGGVPSVLEKVKASEKPQAVGTDAEITGAISTAQDIVISKWNIDRHETYADAEVWFGVGEKLTYGKYYVARDGKGGWVVKPYGDYKGAIDAEAKAETEPKK